MFRHSLAMAFANLARAPFTAGASIVTLALGLACFIAAWGIATYWRSADGHHRNADRIAVIGESVTAAGQERADVLNAISSPAIARDLKQDFPQVERTARTLASREVGISSGDRKALIDMAYVEPDFLEIFDLDFLAGDARRALAEPGGVVLTQAAAQRLFGDAPALGRSVSVGGAWEATVTGVIAPVRQPSFMGTNPDAALRFDMLASWASNPRLAQIERQRWGALWGYTFVSLSPAMPIEALNARLPDFVARRAPPEQQAAARIELRALPMSQLTTHALDNLLFAQSGAPVTTISALLGLGLLTLLVACVNYANLATAQAATRAKEIATRRLLGAKRIDIMTGAWLDAGLLTAAATALALAILALTAPVLQASTGIDVLYFLKDGWGALAGLGALVSVAAFAAGAYPGLVLSRALPAEAVRSGRSRSGPKLLSAMLVGVQFASASFLLILVIVTQLQREHLESTALAPREDPILVLNDISRLGMDYDTLATSLAAIPGVQSVSVVDKPLLGGAGVNLVQFARSADAAPSAPGGYFKAVGYDYFATVNLGVLAGRVFDRQRDPAPVDLMAAGQTANIVIDRAYAARLGFPTPEAAVGQVIYVPASFAQAPAARPARIIGVTETEPTLLTRGDEEGTIYTYTPRAPWGGQVPIVRISRENVPATIAAITRAWDRIAPTAPINIRFFDDLFRQSFRAHERIGQLFLLLAGAAFIIASVGQLGMAVHAAGRRRHEIGVRKTLGATLLGVMRLLLVDFSRPALAANLAAWPLAWVVGQAYLSGFADRMALTPAPFLMSMVITLGIAAAAVIGVVLKTATVRPAEVLRHA
jgi:putative ABC transport system permease protein